MSLAQPISVTTESLIPTPAIVVDTRPVDEWWKLYLSNCIESAKAQMSALYSRCDACAQSQASQRKSNARKGAEDLGFRLRINEEADQNSDMSALLMDLIVRDGKVAKILPGAGASEHQAQLVQMALYHELEKSQSIRPVRKGIFKYVVFPFSGLEAVRGYKNGESCYYLEAINPHTFAVSDTGRPMDRQFSAHKLYSLTKAEMRRAGFKNLDKLSAADSMMGTKTRINSQSSTQNQSLQVAGNETYDVYKSWVCPPFLDAMTGISPKFRPEQLWAWLEPWAQAQLLPPEYIFDDTDMGMEVNDSGRLLIVHHLTNGTILHITTNSLATPTEFPHHTSSFHEPVEEVFAGESQSERSADSFAGLDVMINACMDNARMIANQSMFVSDRSGVPDEKLLNIYKARGIVRFAGDEDPEQMFKFFKPDSIVPDLWPMVQFFKGNIEQNGVNDVMRGISKARTATENSNNNARGQTQVNRSGSRFVDECIVPAVKDIVRMICANYTEEDWYKVCGESAADMLGQPGMADPAWVDRNFIVVGVGSFEYMNQQAKVAELANLANVFGMYMPPDMGQRAYKVALEHTRLSVAEIEEIIGSKGSYTDIMEEIAALKANPWTSPEVLPTDDHWGAIQAVLMVEMGDPMTGEPPWPGFTQFRGVKDYLMMHQIAIQALMQQQMEMGMMQSAMAPPGGEGGKTPKGNTKQITDGKLPQDDISLVRSAGQTGSPTDFQRKPSQIGRGAPVG